jgi:hypothetical protein
MPPVSSPGESLPRQSDSATVRQSSREAKGTKRKGGSEAGEQKNQSDGTEGRGQRAEKCRKEQKSALLFLEKKKCGNDF